MVEAQISLTREVRDSSVMDKICLSLCDLSIHARVQASSQDQPVSRLPG